ncbi:hypothetical protein AALP_AA1G122900 [Arabis alpina]|uniref:DUF4408 domain-containing protein n=1 Tax=Arabis alpina TaxID=50452 RepID=A0A087HMR3_ARAAL|nr:hypothetical protein AALP_AA1G122900 [Arabis alpina]
MASWIKPVLISTGVVAIAMHLKVIVPATIAIDFSQAPILLSYFLSWLRPPYLYVIINVIIVVIGVSSRLYRTISSNNDGNKDYEVSYNGDYNNSHKSHQTEQHQFDHQHQDRPRRSDTKEADFSFVAVVSPSKIIVEVKERPEVVKEKLAEATAMVDEEKEMSLVVVGEPEKQSSIEKPSSVEKPLVTARIGHRKLVKTTTAERNSFKALKVAKPRKHETLENTWKLITEGKPPPLTSHYRRPDTFGLGSSEQQTGLKKSETFKDRTKFYLSPAVSRSRDELNKRAEAFIKKCNNERFESMRVDKERTRCGLSF